MSVKVRIPAPLQKLTSNKSEVEVEAATIKELVESLEKVYPGIKGRICDESGKIRRFINFYVNDEDVRFLKGDDTVLKDADQVSIIPAIAGGAGENRK
ncbi:MAG: molybdopterin synthase sulfur carrier subunit [Candidatus Omnitrophica bacterium CG11_big_fil_rev_8_21_14_0_20_42_13]|uniref:Molybdopterin synthase sulfur carrier subunit n=1 Tax=Candidatus Ghiorseimicrobium undicola TaxID=1974746 RepID=A0A2H0LXV3_9BACT|nr:MAG: molybdopterin synthase sulfur carrier subunit [Candidatus Omnitrophica bacterium CG11_big_fil_rev_8_21_14_0_20_42_13]